MIQYMMLFTDHGRNELKMFDTAVDAVETTQLFGLLEECRGFEIRVDPNILRIWVETELEVKNLFRFIGQHNAGRGDLELLNLVDGDPGELPGYYC